MKVWLLGMSLWFVWLGIYRPATALGQTKVVQYPPVDRVAMCKSIERQFQGYYDRASGFTLGVEDQVDMQELLRCASQGRPLSNYLAWCAYLGNFGVKEDDEKSDHFIVESYKIRYPDAVFMAGLSYTDNEMKKSHLIRRAAELGSLDAQTYLGHAALDWQNQPKEAIPWFMAASLQGDVWSTIDLAAIYMREEFKDRPKAEFYLRRAITMNAGSKFSEFEDKTHKDWAAWMLLGHFLPPLEKPEGVESKSPYTLVKLAERVDTLLYLFNRPFYPEHFLEIAPELGKAYELGIGTSADATRAAFFYRVCAERNESNDQKIVGACKESFSRITASFSPEEISRIESDVRKLKRAREINYQKGFSPVEFEDRWKFNKKSCHPRSDKPKRILELPDVPD